MNGHLDPETVERFVLDRLAEAERLAAEEHVRTCAACQAAIDAELRIAAAAKRLGRDHAKARLGRHLRGERAIPWARYVAAAAVIIVLLSVGILNRWFVTHDIPSPMALQEKRDIRVDAPPAVTAQPRDNDKNEVGNNKNEIEKEGAHKATDERSLQRVTPRLELADQPTAGSGEVKALSRPDDRAAAPAQLGAESRFAVEPGYWTEGIAVSPSPAGKMTGNALAAEEADAMKSKKESGYIDRAKDQQGVILSQRRAGELPIGQRRQQRGGVPTYIEEMHGSTHLTLYLDVLVDPATLQAAQVERRGADTLVVRLRTQSIIYQLPQQRVPAH